MLDYYTPGQQKVERGFRFLKDPWFMANTLFLKSPKRIMALMMIMTLCLLIYGALEYRKRSTPPSKNFPDRLVSFNFFLRITDGITRAPHRTHKSLASERIDPGGLLPATGA
jgi:transposase